MAIRPPRIDSMEGHTRGGRSSSFSSDVMSNSAKSTPNNIIPHANPSAGYIAQTEASDLLSAELDRKVSVSPPALSLLNEFLDHVLYSIISTSHSVALGPLKHAVPAVLKPRLGKAALRVAEEELKEYMEDEEAEELYSNHAIQPKTDFDVELVWKMARLRCMVYARMGDLEEEDEEEWLEKEHLLEQAMSAPISARQSMAVTPGSAIFLTSVIEYLGEQALYYAAQYAQKRHDNSTSVSHDRHSDIVLEGKDMNHVGRDSPLSRLWRSWRRNTRTPGESRPMSPESLLTPTTDSIHSRATSNGHHQIQPIIEERRSSNGGIIPQTPTRIPLPDSEIDEDEYESGRRPMSMPHLPGNYPESIATPPDTLHSWQDRPPFERQRSNSVPVHPTPFGNLNAYDRDSFALPIQGADTQHENSETSPNNVSVYQQVTVNETLAQSDDTPKALSPQSQRQFNDTVGTLATALGAVGVHHVRDLPASTGSQLSASIKSPDDFDHGYAPETQIFAPSSRPNPAQLDVLSANKENRHSLKIGEHEDHRRYSATSHDMETPSIYSHKEFSPRAGHDSERFDQSSRQSASPEVARQSHDRTRSLRSGLAAERPSSATSGKQAMSDPVQRPVDEYVLENTVGHSKSSSSSSRLLGFTRDPNGRPQTISQQRAAGDMSDEMRRAHSSTPNGGSSPAPQNVPFTPPKKQFLPVGGEAELTHHKTMSNEEAKKSLEVLINGNETLHYTLTPAQASFNQQELQRTPPRAATQDLADFLRTTTSSEDVRPHTTQGERENQGATPPSFRARKESLPTSSKTQIRKNPVGEPRAATIDRQSGVRDLADYMRSTGPATEDQLPKPLTGTSINTNRPATQPTPRSTKPVNRLKFQARDARPTRTAESSALIDFIREGPPRETGDHRINRHIAPFRTTMDSDDLNVLASSLPKASSDNNGMKSEQTTLNSTTPLISTAKQPANVDSDEGALPKKNRRRVKDPYAIDDSDDEMFDAPQNPQTNEESLIDFLRNTSPPASMTAQPILSAQALSSTKPQALGRSPSVDKLKDFVRNARSNSLNKVQESKARSDSPHLTQTGSKLDSYRPTGVTHAAHVDRNRANKLIDRAESRATNSGVGNRMDVRAASRIGNFAADSRMESRGGNAEKRGVGGTADLADYLRNTGPPPGDTQPVQPFLLNGRQTKKEEGSLKKFFSMRGRK